MYSSVERVYRASPSGAVTDQIKGQVQWEFLGIGNVIFLYGCPWAEIILKNI